MLIDKMRFSGVKDANPTFKDIDGKWKTRILKETK